MEWKAVRAYWRGSFACVQRNIPRRISADRKRADLRSNGFRAGFAGANADHIREGGHKNFPVANLPGAGHRCNRLDGLGNIGISDDEFQLHLRQEIDGVFSPTIGFFMPALPAEPADFADSHALNARLREGVLDVFELVMTN